jgi:hypothetical protein
MRKAPKRILKRPRDSADGTMGMALFNLPDEVDGTTLLVVPRVGQVQHLPTGYELNTCDQCSSPVWVNSSFMAHYRRRGLKLRIECMGCPS